MLKHGASKQCLSNNRLLAKVLQKYAIENRCKKKKPAFFKKAGFLIIVA